MRGERRERVTLRTRAAVPPNVRNCRWPQMTPAGPPGSFQPRPTVELRASCPCVASRAECVCGRRVGSTFGPRAQTSRHNFGSAQHARHPCRVPTRTMDASTPSAHSPGGALETCALSTLIAFCRQKAARGTELPRDERAQSLARKRGEPTQNQIRRQATEGSALVSSTRLRTSTVTAHMAPCCSWQKKRMSPTSRKCLPPNSQAIARTLGCP